MFHQLFTDESCLMKERKHLRFLKWCLCGDMKHDDVLAWEEGLRQNIDKDLRQLEENPNMTLSAGDTIDDQMMALLLMEDLLGPHIKSQPKVSKIPIRIKHKKLPVKIPTSKIPRSVKTATSNILWPVKTLTSKIPRPVKAKAAEEKPITDNKDAVGQTMQKAGTKAQGNAAKPRWRY